MKIRLLIFLCLLIYLQPLNAAEQGFSVFADVLYWNTSEQTDGMWSSVITSPQPGKIVFNPENIHFNSSVGARGGLGYQAQNNRWDAKLFWTYVPASTEENNPIGNQIILPEFFSGFLSNDSFLGASLDWQFTMNMVDLELGHQFNVTPSFSLHPTLGIKGGTINQWIDANWKGLLFNSTEKVTQQYFGVGPSFGIDAKWKLYRGLSLTGDFAMAFMWGTWDIDDIYKRPSALLGIIPKTTIKTSVDDSELGTMMIDYFLGLEYAYQGRSDVIFKLGYEMQYWANQLRIPTFQQLPLHGDLTLQGGTCGLYINL